MLYNLDTNENLKTTVEVLLVSLGDEPIHQNNPFRNSKFLGHYLGLQGTKENPEAIQIYDLWVAECSKFNYKNPHQRHRYKPKFFIARYGEGESDYNYEFIESLSMKDNNELKKYAVGECYRRYKNRTKFMGL